MNKEENLKRKMQLKTLSKLKTSLNFEIQMASWDKELSDEEKEAKVHQIIERLHGTEIKEIELRRNKLGSKFYKFEPFIGLNRKQRRSL